MSIGDRANERGVLHVRKILVVEDDALIAMELGERLADMGYEVLGPAHTIAEAEALIERAMPDGALLDASLAGGFQACNCGITLHAKGVRVAFCTGYDKVKDAPPELAKAPIFTKPVSDADLQAPASKSCWLNSRACARPTPSAPPQRRDLSPEVADMTRSPACH